MAYGGGGPAEWAAMQQQQRQQQLNNILQMFMAMKQYQTEQGWQQREWENKLQQQNINQQQEERRIGAYEGGQKRLLEQEERMANKKPDWFSQAEMISEILKVPIGQVVAMMKMPQPTQGRQTPEEYAANVRAGERVRREFEAPQEEKKTRSAFDKEYRTEKINVNRFYDRKIADADKEYGDMADEFVQAKDLKKANAVMARKQAYLKDLGVQREEELLKLKEQFQSQMQVPTTPSVTPAAIAPAVAPEPQTFPKVLESKVKGKQGKALPDGRTIIKIDGTWFEVIKGQ